MEQLMRMEIDGQCIATVRMNNGENRCRLSFAEEFLRLIDEIEKNESIKGVIITGSGKFFSLGLDIEYFKTQGEEYVTKTRNALGLLYKRIMMMPVPTVAAVNGHAFGAGAFLALSCDYRVMRRDRGWLCWPEVHLNLRMRPTSYFLIRSKFSTAKAIQNAILFGKRLTADESADLNLVDRVTAGDQLLTEAAGLINSALGPRGIGRDSLLRNKTELYGLDGLNNALEESKL